MERKILGILVLAIVGILGISMVVAMPFSSSENRDAAREAVETGDYDAWKAAVSAEITEENFEKMTRVHDLKTQIREAREAGDDEVVEALMDEFKELMPEGLMGRGRGRGKMGSGKGFSKGFNKGGGNHGGCPFAE
ncbi:hypothetical protein HOA55_05215 [archaeon]|nr:hypothetical protein [archaeon]MBT3577721.1 hypothetical protein [archaeon]MBT6820728.1 hypothetical protein [archaeon]MBT6955900.1 hypothetical protein [archaeon]MBT7025868.1 hypothetical protein [archaeon]